MKCQRCGNDKEAEFRVISDILDMKVCADCAAEARKIGLTLEIVKIDEANNDGTTSNNGRQRRGGKSDSTGSKHRHPTQRRVAWLDRQRERREFYRGQFPFCKS
jgi:hypothetical protein